MDTTLDASLRELLARITPLCSHYSNVVQFCEDQSGAGAAGAAVGSGRVNQALAGALYSLVKDYYIFVTQLERQQKESGDLTLNKVWYYVQPTMATMASIAEVCRTVEKCNARGGKTLSLLHHHLVSNQEICMVYETVC